MQTQSLTASTDHQYAVQLAAIASGKRTTAAAVDSSGLAIANALTAQADNFAPGASNAQNAINAAKVAAAATATISASAQDTAANSNIADIGIAATVSGADSVQTQKQIALALQANLAASGLLGFTNRPHNV